MAILDMQGMETPTAEFGGHKSNKSRSCGGGASTLSLLLC